MEAENSASKIANRELQKQLNQERKKSDEAENQLKKKNDIISKLRSVVSHNLRLISTLNGILIVMTHNL